MDINTLEEKLGIANLSDAEKLALVKGIESNVQASKAAVKAQEAGQYASLVVDAIKRIKNDLETRFNELNGIIDVKAKTLQDGKDGLQGAKGEKGDRGFDGTNGKDGYNGKDGIDGVDGKDGVGVRDAYIDFDGSLVIKLTDGTEINVGEVVPMDVAEKIKIIGNGGGTSQSVLDTLADLQTQIDALSGGGLGTMSTQDADAVAITGGTINGTTVGATTAAAGTFTTLIGGGGSANYFQTEGAATTKAVEAKALGSDTNIAFVIDSKGTGAIDLAAGSSGVNISNGGTVTAITRTAGGSGYSTAPTVTISAPTTAGGVQATATCTVTAGAVNTTFTITNAGSGYVEQPTVTFSGGGGSGAAAYATVGSGAVIRALGASGTQALDFHTAASATNTFPVLRLRDVSIGTSNTGFVQIQNNNGYSSIIAQGPTNAALNVASNGTGSILFNTNSTNETNQMRVAHTASAVNYVQVTGAATSGQPTISAQGSDANIRLTFASKGSEGFQFTAAGSRQLFISAQTSAVNYLQIVGSQASASPVLSAQGSDTNIDLTLTPKGTGNVRFGTYTADMTLVVQGYITIKDSGGTVRKLAVIA